LHEVTRNLSIELVDVETPVAAMKAWQILGKKVTLAPFLRAGVGLPDGLLAWSLPPGWPISTFTALQGVVGGETFGTRWCGKLGETSRRTIRPILA
jgi:hypothetical protein